MIAGSDNDGIDIFGAGTDGNVIAGNYIGTDLTGTSPLGIAGDGVCIAVGAAANWVGVNPDGGAAVGDEGNVISGTGYDGVQTYESNDNVIAGDKIGTDVTGAVALGNAEDGVQLYASSDNTIGGTGAGAADVISANGTSSGFFNGPGVELSGSSENVVEGDFIGTDTTGTRALGNGQGGVEIDVTYFGPSTGNTIGGTFAAASNLITNNGGPGVAVTGDASIGNAIIGDRIFDNTGQAIELGDNGVTYNSPSPRQGPNNLQNFPVVGQAADGQPEGWLGGSTPNTPFRLDFYASTAYGPGDSGDARTTWARSKSEPIRPDRRRSQSLSRRLLGCRLSRPQPPIHRGTHPKSHHHSQAALRPNRSSCVWPRVSKRSPSPLRRVTASICRILSSGRTDRHGS